MKKSLFILVAATNWLLCAECYSIVAIDQYPMAIASINSNLATQSSNLNSIWSRINVNQARNILENFKSKKRILTNIRTLSKEDDMTLSNQLHETELKRELDGLLIDAWSVE